MKNITFYTIAAISMALIGCTSTDDTPMDPGEPAEYDPTPYVIDNQLLPPVPPLPQGVVLTQQGVALGKMLFHEKQLSKDGSQACASCHLQEDAFTDNRRFSIGVDGNPGTRQAMTIFNIAWLRPGGPGAGGPSGFFWDGRAATLHEQALMPIQDPLEMNETLENCVAKLSASQEYRDQFTRAFGSDSITSEKIGLALEQFMFSIVSGNSKFDQVQAGTAMFTASEERGRQLFTAPPGGGPGGPGGPAGAGCQGCHGAPTFTNNGFMNNGLDAEANFTDLGRFNVTNNPDDRARFKTTSLRNIAITSPYMHDGRFTTLEEVIEHYNTGVQDSPTLDQRLRPNLRPGGLRLTDQDKVDLVAFLKTLTDETLMSNPEYQQ